MLLSALPLPLFLAIDLVLPLVFALDLAITCPLSLHLLRLIRLHRNPGVGQQITANTYVSTLA